MSQDSTYNFSDKRPEVSTSFAWNNGEFSERARRTRTFDPSNYFCYCWYVGGDRSYGMQG